MSFDELLNYLFELENNQDLADLRVKIQELRRDLTKNGLE